MALKDDPLAYAIVGCAMRVHSALGHGFLESTYGDALEIEFRQCSIPFSREGEIRVFYNGHPLATRYRADFVCGNGQCIVELKAVKKVTTIEWAQVMHYLRASHASSAVLLNFGAPKLHYDYFDRASLRYTNPESPEALAEGCNPSEFPPPPSPPQFPGALAKGCNPSEFSP